MQSISSGDVEILMPFYKPLVNLISNIKYKSGYLCSKKINSDEKKNAS